MNIRLVAALVGVTLVVVACGGGEVTHQPLSSGATLPTHVSRSRSTWRCLSRLDFQGLRTSPHWMIP